MTTQLNSQVTPNSPNPTSPDMENGARSSTGLVVAGLVTIVGSWIGMAAYLDYRLNEVEQNQQKVVSAVDSARSTLNEQIQTLAEQNRAALSDQLYGVSQNLSEKIKDTSGVLAKGILDLTQKEDDHFAAAMGLLNENKTHLAGALEAQQTTQSSILSAIQNLDQHLASAHTALQERIDATAGSLQELVQQSDQNTLTQLNELASSLSENAKQILTETQQFSSELTALARQVTDLESNVHSSQQILKTMNENLPAWQDASAQQITAAQTAALTTQDNLRKDLENLQQKINEISLRLDSTADSMMKALYLTSEGLEGARIELKTEFENTRNETAAEIQNLVQSVRGITETLEKLKTADNQSSLETQSGRLMPQDVQPLQALNGSLREITDKANLLREQITSQVEEAKARAQILLNRSDDPGQAQALVEILSQFTSLADLAGGQLQAFAERIDSLTEPTAVPENQPRSSSLTVLESPESPAPAPAGINPEERPVDPNQAAVNE